MKRIFTILLMVVTTFLLVACGKETKKESGFCGTWNVISAEKDGTEFTIEELETMGDDTLSDFQIIVKGGGKAYAYSQGNGVLVDWEKTENGIKIGVQEFALSDGKLSIENNGIKLNLEKTSDSQTIPNNLKSEKETEIVEQEEIEETYDLSEGIRPEFEEAMDSYEEFFDEYIEFMQEYNATDDAVDMLEDYTDYMKQYADTMKKMETLGDEEMSTEEALYYAEVTARITEKLASIN